MVDFIFLSTRQVSEGLAITNEHAVTIWGGQKETDIYEPEPDFDPPKITSVESLENAARPEWQDIPKMTQPTDIVLAGSSVDVPETTEVALLGSSVDVSETTEVALPGSSVDVSEPQPVKTLDSPTPDLDLPEKVPTLESVKKQFADYWRESGEKALLDKAFQNELVQNYKADKEVLNELLKSTSDWIKKTDNELNRYHFKDPWNEVKSTKFTRENIEDYKQKYRNRRYFVQEKNNLISTKKSRLYF